MVLSAEIEVEITTAAVPGWKRCPCALEPQRLPFFTPAGTRTLATRLLIHRQSTLTAVEGTIGKLQDLIVASASRWTADVASRGPTEAKGDPSSGKSRRRSRRPPGAPLRSRHCPA